MYKPFVVVICLLTLWLTHLLANHFIYRGLGVTNHAELTIKTQYAQINNHDLQAGAFDFVESTLCHKITDDLTRQCIADFNQVKAHCVKKHLDGVDVMGFTEQKVNRLLEQFNQCSQHL
ncbi:MAG: hypothetical protein MJK04_30725 [Psychrosphaera sp.]|nr:hypothetical protein [Psychrosphaera sp.]